MVCPIFCNQQQQRSIEFVHLIFSLVYPLCHLEQMFYVNRPQYINSFCTRDFKLPATIDFNQKRKKIRIGKPARNLNMVDYKCASFQVSQLFNNTL